MDRRLRIAGIVAAAAAAAAILSSPGAPPPLPDPSTTTGEGNKSVEVLATGLQKPRAMALADDGRMFLTEKSGRIRVFENGELLERPLATFRVPAVFDGGLLGIALHPDFGDNRRMYVYHTYVQDDALWNKVTVVTEDQNRVVDAHTVLDGIPGSRFSNGGVLKFGPDGMLYVGTGSVSDSSHAAQDPGSLAGKILRMRDDGGVPADNPAGGSVVYAAGFRNPQGMAWDGSGSLYVTDMGPTKNDEINLVVAGGNYGWPQRECGGSDSDGVYAGPVLCYDPAIEPGGILVHGVGMGGGTGGPLGGGGGGGDDGGEQGGQRLLVMASLRASGLYTVDLDNPGLQTQEFVLGGAGRIRDVAQGPDGSLYVLTSNTDGKGFPTADDDRLLRIVR